MTQKNKNNLLFNYVGKEKRLFAMTCLMSIVITCLQIINPQITRYFLDVALSANIQNNLFYAAAIFMGIAFILQFFRILMSYFGQRFAWNVTDRMRIDLLSHCMDLDMDFHKEHNQGEFQERIEGDISSVFALFSEIIQSIGSSLLLLVGILVVSFYEHIYIGLFMVIYSAVSISVLFLIKVRTEDSWVEAGKMNANYYSFVGELLQNRETIKHNKALNFLMYRYDKLVCRLYPVLKKANLTWATIWSGTTFIFAFGTISSIAVGYFLWNSGAITLGTVFLIYNYTESLRRPIEQLKVRVQQLQEAGAGYKRVEDLFSITNKNEYGKSILKLEGSPSIRFDNVSFGYQDEVIIDNVSIDLDSNQILGIVGRTGSGKTTLVRLLTRLHTPDSGRVLINEVDINSLYDLELTNCISYITQDVQIFSTSLRENIRLFNDNISDNQIFDTINQLGLNEWINKFNMGLDTIFEGGKSNLSAGESQLISFVRAFVKEPNVIILDEATANVDPITQGLIECALDKLLIDKTCIIIAHKLSTLSRCDKVISLESGHVKKINSLDKVIDFQNANTSNDLGYLSEVIVNG